MCRQQCRCIGPCLCPIHQAEVQQELEQEQEAEEKDHDRLDTGNYVEDGEVEEEAHAMDAHAQDVLQLAHHGASVLQGQGQILAVLVH